jgi:hypothetical protein
VASPDVDRGDRGASKSATLVRFHWANWLHRPSVSTCRLRCWPAPLCRHDACACGHFSEPAADAGKCCCIAAAATPKIAGTPLSEKISKEISCRRPCGRHAFCSNQAQLALIICTKVMMSAPLKPGSSGWLEIVFDGSLVLAGQLPSRITRHDSMSNVTEPMVNVVWSRKRLANPKKRSISAKLLAIPSDTRTAPALLPPRCCMT